MAREVPDAISIEAPNGKRKNGCSWLEWCHLLISLSIPLAIITYTIIQNNNDYAIAEKNRQQDLAIDTARREQDIHLANETRLNDNIIAEKNRQQDIMLANDQHEEAILVNYLDSLTELLEKNGMNLNGTPTGRPIARFKTLTALGQLNWKRKSLLIQALIDAKLITTHYVRNPIIDLTLADLTGLNLTDDRSFVRPMHCLALIDVTLTNGFFRRIQFFSATFHSSRLTNSDFSLSSRRVGICDDHYPFGVDFFFSMLLDSNFSYSRYERSRFSSANLIGAQMRNFSCRGCIFGVAHLDSADMSHSTFNVYIEQDDESSFSRYEPHFSGASMVSTLLYQATFDHADFQGANLMRANATGASFIHCVFKQANFANATLAESATINSTFHETNLTSSTWSRAMISNSSFTRADMRHVDFTHVECRHCLFFMTDLTGADFTNASLKQCNFTGANITYEQLKLARILQGVILPNGTRID